MGKDTKSDAPILEKQKELQKKYFELQMANNQLKQIEKQLELIEAQVLEALTIINALDELKSSKQGAKSLAPVANGIFVEAKLENIQDLLVNVGGGIVVKKSVDETKSMLQNQVSELRSAEQELLVQFEQFSAKAQGMQKELQLLM